ncbi:MAG: di-trans,poly-cis-decaprenylcistransferase [Marinosulfonomonas sp.]|nr:di-trans,poly-cis-decaprenylcistransferase [Marinosulfonomonas sp.]
MDGNGRWATARGKPRLFGHQAGGARVREVVEACPELGVKYLTVFAFSTENWKRSPSEVSGLMTLFRRYIAKETKALDDNGICVRFVGSRDRLDKRLVTMMDQLEKLTKDNDTLFLTVAINYGGRDEIARASQRVAIEVAAGRLDAANITAETFGNYLDTAGLPDPDLVIRTSGEARVSNFLLWQSAYSEFDFVETLWPDFSAEVFTKCVTNFAGRERRFGAVTG